MKEFCALRAKTYTYLMDDDNEKKKAKGIKSCIIKRGLMFESYKDSFFINKTILKSQLNFFNNKYDVLHYILLQLTIFLSSRGTL